MIDEPQVRPDYSNTEVMFCAGGKSSYWISWDGKMLPCALMNSPCSFPFSSCFNSAWQEIKHKIGEIGRPDECKTCKYLPYCNVCPGRLQAETGSYEKVSMHICKMTRMSMKKFFNKYERGD
ncbi:MAG TPA: hypothetical protein GXX20_08585 [Clostridiaceae bacterium]|nr:hypothetical protein [Clostridiaceae bacterium]